MAFNIFKKEEEQKAAKTAKSKAAAAKTQAKETVQQDTAQGSVAKKGKMAVNAAAVLKHAHVTEKAAGLAERNQYVFRVAASANKNEIAKTVEKYYGVDVLGVNVVNVPEKRRRRGRGFMTKPGYRKAIVTVKAGQSIEILPK